MICLLLIMTMMCVNGIANAEQKVKHSGTGLREEEMSAKTKAWLLMVESGKVDEEELRRITPKSIFIAPLLSGREEKCKEGYRYDHLGQCVKVIKIDPKVQLEMLLKRLNMLYSEKKEEEKEKETLPEVSSGPLHFSIPILNEGEKVKPEENPKVEQVGASNTESQNTPEFIPIPLPMILMNRTHESSEAVVTNESDQTSHPNQTKEIESSGAGPLNDTEPYVEVQIEGSGVSSGDAPQDQDYTSTISLLSEDTDYLDVAETETTTEIPSTTETTTEIFSSSSAPTVDTVATESYQSITDLPSANDSVVDLLNETVSDPVVVESNSKSDIIHFPSEEPEVRTYTSNSYIRFPDDPPRTPHSYQSPPPVPNWDSQYQIHPSAIPQQFWWLPDNWKVDENQQKSSLVKFWSRLPLIHDYTYTDDKNTYNKAMPTSQPSPQVFNHRSNDYVVSFNHHQVPSRVGKPFRSNRFQEIVPTPRQAYRIQR